MNDLKRRLLEVWNDLDQTIIDGDGASASRLAYKQKEDISNIFFNSIIKPQACNWEFHHKNIKTDFVLELAYTFFLLNQGVENGL